MVNGQKRDLTLLWKADGMGDDGSDGVGEWGEGMGGKKEGPSQCCQVSTRGLFVVREF